tara:strand:+ start:213 stop:848 length:636 start_codon:yes stop_codon:yes gene_type:complete
MSQELQNYILLNELAEQIYANGQRVAVVLEGRDSAGKSSTIRKLTRYLPPYTFRVQHSFKPNKSAMRSWLPYWANKMPRQGEIVFYDRSWYSRALLQPVMGWCSQVAYENFMGSVTDWEDSQNITFIKLWLSISEVEQEKRLNNRKRDPLRYWKFSSNDPVALSKFDMITIYKERMLTETNGWNVLDYNDKKTGKEEALQLLTNTLERTMI